MTPIEWAALVLMVMVAAAITATTYVVGAWWASYRRSRMFRWAVALDIIAAISGGGIAVIAVYVLLHETFPFAGVAVAVLVGLLLLGPIGHAIALWLTGRAGRPDVDVEDPQA